MRRISGNPVSLDAMESVLVHAHDGGIDHLYRRIMAGSQSIHDAVPYARQRTKRLQQVVRGPWISGRPRQGAPDRKTQKMPFAAGRETRSTRYPLYRIEQHQELSIR
jgi:hypothetical protein